MIQLDTITSIYTALVNLLAHIDKDAINGTFELAAGGFVLNHARVLYRDKLVRGVSILSIMFFWLWGLWNMYYYPALNQPISFWGGFAVTCANTFYAGMALYYIRQEALNALDEHEIYLGAESARQGGRP